MAYFKNLLTFFIILTLGVLSISCDKRRSKHQALKDSIEEFKKNIRFETTIYIPETHVEQEVDTLMSNGFRVKIKTYSDMTNSVLFTKIKDTINYQTNYRNYKFDISVTKDNKLIYSEHFDKKKINNAFNYNSNLASGSTLYNFDKLAVLKSIEVNDDPSYTNMVLIDILYAIPESDRSAQHTLVINENGQSKSVQVEAN